MYRPACRINHTGRTSVGRRRQASKNRLFIEAIRIVHPVFALNNSETSSPTIVAARRRPKL